MRITDEAVQAALKHWYKAFDADEDDVIDMRAALIAALPHLPLGYEVKKLDWEPSIGGKWIRATGMDRTYEVRASDSRCEELKAAAQADFERRVRECIVAKPVDVAAVQKAFEEGFENAVEQSLDALHSYDDITRNEAEQSISKLKPDYRALSAEPAQGEQWLPIETAPINQSILVHYDDGEIELINADDNDYAWVAYTGKQDFCTKPTHWMPLPSAPTPEEEA